MDIEKLVRDLKDNLLALLGDQLKEFRPELENDLNEYISLSREKLERWSLLLAENTITEEEFKWLLKSQQELISLKALQSAGLSKIRLNTIKNSVIKIVFQTVLLAI